MDLSFSIEVRVSRLGHVRAFGLIGSDGSGLKLICRALFFLWEPRQLFYKNRK